MEEIDEIEAMEKVLEKFFRDEKTMYFHSSDAFQGEFGEPYLTWKYLRGMRSKVVIYMGSDEYDETPLKVCHTAESLENLLTALVY